MKTFFTFTTEFSIQRILLCILLFPEFTLNFLCFFVISPEFKGNKCNSSGPLAIYMKQVQLQRIPGISTGTSTTAANNSHETSTTAADP